MYSYDNSGRQRVNGKRYGPTEWSGRWMLSTGDIHSKGKVRYRVG